MRLLLLSQWFDPENAPKGLSFAKALASRGWTVEVLTGFPNYPNGKIYAGYRVRLFKREIMEGIPITRVALYPSHDASSFRRILNYLSFAISAAILGLFLTRKANVMYVYHPPATVAFPALVLHFLKGIPFVYDIQDLWPDSLRVTGMIRHTVVLNLVGAWCKFTYRHATAIVVLSPGMKKELSNRGVDQMRISVIYNWFDTKNLSCADRIKDDEKTLLQGKFNIVFAGTLGKAQALDAVIDARKLLSDLSDVQFVFVGGGVEVEYLKKKADIGSGPAILFLPQRSIRKIVPLLREADVLLIHLKRDPLFKITIPSKTQAYLAVGKPIIIGVEGDAADLVLAAEAGLSCEPESPESIAFTVRSLYTMSPSLRIAMGDNGRKFYNEYLSFEKSVGNFDVLFKKIAEIHAR
jgi:glycosyltransferase involved in cell wall biosynthesis